MINNGHIHDSTFITASRFILVAEQLNFQQWLKHPKPSFSYSDGPTNSYDFMGLFHDI